MEALLMRHTDLKTFELDRQTISQNATRLWKECRIIWIAIGAVQRTLRSLKIEGWQETVPSDADNYVATSAGDELTDPVRLESKLSALKRDLLVENTIAQRKRR